VQELGDAEVLKQQACYLPCSDDGLPVIGRVPGLQNAYVATGHSCWGILNAPATGEALAELIVHGSSKSSDLRAFDPARFVAAGARR
jgi:glycine/D-amino acid oxidase-like deaminating enzyme